MRRIRRSNGCVSWMNISCMHHRSSIDLYKWKNRWSLSSNVCPWIMSNSSERRSRVWNGREEKETEGMIVRIFRMFVRIFRRMNVIDVRTSFDFGRFKGMFEKNEWRGMMGIILTFRVTTIRFILKSRRRMAGSEYSDMGRGTCDRSRKTGAVRRSILERRIVR